MAPNYDSTALFSVKGLVVVITGGGSGLGANVAHALDANGAKAVYILGRRSDALQRTVSAGKNNTIIPIVCDVTSKDSLEAAANQVKNEQGYIDVLFANSGMIGPPTSSLFTNGPPCIESLQSQLWAVPMADFTQPYEVNVTGVFYTALAFLQLLDAGNKRAAVPQKSQILVTTSIAGYARSPAAGFAYSMSKAAATHMVKQFTTTFAPYQIRANAITPGFYPSEMTVNMPWMKGGQNPRVEGALSASITPLQRTGTEEDIAGLAMFLMSPAGAYVNGGVHLTDGGRIGIVPATY